MKIMAMGKYIPFFFSMILIFFYCLLDKVGYCELVVGPQIIIITSCAWKGNLRIVKSNPW